MTQDLWLREFQAFEARVRNLLQEQANRDHGELEAIHGALRAIQAELERLKPRQPWWHFWGPR